MYGQNIALIGRRLQMRENRIVGQNAKIAFRSPTQQTDRVENFWVVRVFLPQLDRPPWVGHRFAVLSGHEVKVCQDAEFSRWTERGDAEVAAVADDFGKRLFVGIIRRMADN